MYILMINVKTYVSGPPLNKKFIVIEEDPIDLEEYIIYFLHERGMKPSQKHYKFAENSCTRIRWEIKEFKNGEILEFDTLRANK